MSRSRWLIAAGAVVLLVAGIGCTRSSDPSAGRLTVDGQAEVTRPGENRREVTDSRTLAFGDRVRVRQGTAVIQLPDDRRLELRMGSDVELQAAEAKDQVRPAFMGGDLLVISDEAPLTVAVGDAEVAVQGDARISRGVALLVAAYEGASRLRAGGSELEVPALRQAALPPTGRFPTRVSPLEYSPSDSWDRRYLGDAMDLGNQLNARSQGFSAQLGPTEGRSFGYFRDLLPRLADEPGFAASLLNPARLPGETLVGAVITLEGTRGSFAERWAAVFTFRDEGAPWGLVALDQGVTRAPLLEMVDTAIGSRPTGFAEAPLGGGPGSVPAPGTGGGPATTVAGPRTTTPTAPGPRPGTPTTTPPPPPPPPPPPNIPTGPLNTGGPLDDPVNSLVDTLTGLLKSLGQQ